MGITTNSRKNRQNTNKTIAIFIIILEAPAKDQNIKERIVYQATTSGERNLKPYNVHNIPRLHETGRECRY